MADGQRRGPYRIDQLVEAGVGPSTYVWCKGMDDWQRADEVAEICRFWRRRLAGIHDADEELKNTDPKMGDDNPSGEDMNPHIGRATILGPEQDSMSNPDPETLRKQPANGMMLAVLFTLLCFPPTGFVAIFMYWRSAAEWARSLNVKGEEAEGMRRAAWDYSRQGRMWTGITFFLGLILWALLFRLHF